LLHYPVRSFDPARAAAPIHPAWCGCRSCRPAAPAGGLRHRRLVQLQAVLLLAFLGAIYGMAILFAADIARAFGWAG
jgi:hypothetical protein